MTKDTNATGQRIVFADWLRVIACFLVMLVHASENFYGVITEKAIASIPGAADKLTGCASNTGGMAGDKAVLLNEANRFWVSFYDGGVARTCVPLFMIISAFLLVPMKPGVTMTQFYKRRFTRILPPMIIFMLLYALLPLLLPASLGGFGWDTAKEYLLTVPFNFPGNAGHLWFMFPLISLYLIIPVVSPWLERASAKDERIFIALFTFSTFIPWLHSFGIDELWGECFWNRYSMLWYCSGYLGYLVLAHYIRYHIDWSHRKRLVVGLACFLVGASFTAWSFWVKGTPLEPIATPQLEWAWEFCTPNVLLATFGAFMMFTAIRQPKAPAIVTSISKLSFGMYLMHIFFLVPIANFFVQDNPASPIIPVYLAIPCIAILTYSCCVITAKLISLIPGSKWIIG